jgi:hypothetical protein
VDNTRIQVRVARCKPTTKDTMKENIFDVLTAIALGLVLAGFALAYFDILTY